MEFFDIFFTTSSGYGSVNQSFIHCNGNISPEQGIWRNFLDSQSIEEANSNLKFKSYLSINCSLGGVGSRAMLNSVPLSSWPPEYFLNHALKATMWASDFVGKKQGLCQFEGPNLKLLQETHEIQEKQTRCSMLSKSTLISKKTC